MGSFSKQGIGLLHQCYLIMWGPDQHAAHETLGQLEKCSAGASLLMGLLQKSDCWCTAFLPKKGGPGAGN